MSEHLSPRVNSRRLPDFLNRTVRLPCKVISFHGSSVVVEASDGGQVSITNASTSDIHDTFVEVVGNVQDASTIKALAIINMGEKLDLKLANDVTEMTFDSRFRHMFFE